MSIAKKLSSTLGYSIIIATIMSNHHGVIIDVVGMNNGWIEIIQYLFCIFLLNVDFVLLFYKIAYDDKDEYGMLTYFYNGLV